jgi:hypothetical protein
VEHISDTSTEDGELYDMPLCGGGERAWETGGVGAWNVVSSLDACSSSCRRWLSCSRLSMLLTACSATERAWAALSGDISSCCRMVVGSRPGVARTGLMVRLALLLSEGDTEVTPVMRLKSLFHPAGIVLGIYRSMLFLYTFIRL